MDGRTTVFNTADHLKKFWDPRMRKAIVDYVEAGGEGLQLIVLKAVRSLSPRVVANGKNRVVGQRSLAGFC